MTLLFSQFYPNDLTVREVACAQCQRPLGFNLAEPEPVLVCMDCYSAVMDQYREPTE